MMWWDGFGWGWGMWLGMIFMVIFWVAVIVLIVWAIRHFSMRSGTSGPSALDIARERYAKSEISQEEFEKIKKSLS